MESYLWWTEEQKRFAEEVHEFVKEVMPRDAETRWTREFPWDIFQKIGEKGFYRGGYPEGVWRSRIGSDRCMHCSGSVLPDARARQGLCRQHARGLAAAHRIRHRGTEKSVLPRIAKGELGAIVITEPFAGTDAAAIETTAKREGDVYILNGKKRYIVSAGVATRHMVYARTSNDPEDIRSYRHLTAFIVEKGTPGLSVEKINEIIGFENIQNGVLNFDKVSVPVKNRVRKGKDGG
jgi:Acyl-CoA dehydrogenases